MNNNTNDLIKLSKIFKKGFTVELKNGQLNQYTNYDKPFIVAYKTIIKIKPLVWQGINKKIPTSCIIGGWFDSEDNTYYIELNKAFSSLFKAEEYAIKHKQKCFYNIRNGVCIKPREWKVVK